MACIGRYVQVLLYNIQGGYNLGGKMYGKKLCFVVVFTVFACFSQFTQAAEWKASASSSGENLDPQSAIDGDPSTRWSSKFEDNQWLIIDLGQPIEIKKITLTR